MVRFLLGIEPSLATIDNLHVFPVLGLRLVGLYPELLEVAVCGIEHDIDVAAVDALGFAESGQLRSLDRSVSLFRVVLGSQVSTELCLCHTRSFEMGLDLPADFRGGIVYWNGVVLLACDC